jgi:hypothetical protein
VVRGASVALPGQFGTVRVGSGAVRGDTCWVRGSTGWFVLGPCWVRSESLVKRSVSVLGPSWYGTVRGCLGFSTVEGTVWTISSRFTPEEGHSGSVAIRDNPCCIRRWCDPGFSIHSDAIHAL